MIASFLLALLLGPRSVLLLGSAVPEPTTLSVLVSNHDLGPLPRATVVLTRPEPWRGPPARYEAVTDIKGQALFKLNTMGTFDVTVCMSGFHPTRLLRIPNAGTYRVLLNLDFSNPDEHMVTAPDSTPDSFDPCRATLQSGSVPR
jgi:hypothetical protein